MEGSFAKIEFLEEGKIYSPTHHEDHGVGLICLDVH